MIEPHWHWTFLAFNGEVGEGGAINWPVEVTVTGRYTEEDASVMVSSVVQREHYQLRRVYECTTCGFQETTSKSMETLAENSK